MKQNWGAVFLGMALLLGMSLAEARAVVVKPKGRAKPAYDAYAMPAPAPAPTPVVEKERHWYGGLLYSTANQINYRGTMNLGGTPISYTAVEKVGTSPGVSGGYIKRSPWWFGYGGELTYELPRSSQGITGSGGGLLVNGTYDQAPSNSLLILAVNGNYSLGASFYFVAGVNFPFVFSGGDQSLSGQMGTQEGLGYAFTEKISAELQYRQLVMKGSINNPSLSLGIDQATFNGFLLSVRYLLW
jgi:hypothetical protein